MPRTAEEPEPWVLPPLPGNRAGPLPERLAGLTTHMSLWPASPSFARWLEARQHELRLNRPGLRLLELGSGTGWLGRVLAANLPGAAVVLTDREEAAAELKERCLEGAMPNLQVEVLDWRRFVPVDGCIDQGASLPQASVDGWDLVIGADLAWNSETIGSLPWVLRAALEDAARRGTNTVVLYGHWCRAPRSLAQFLEACAAAGLDVTRDNAEVSGPASSSTEEVVAEAPPPAASTREGRADSDSEESEPEVWAQWLFGEADVEEPPVFSVYSITLSGTPRLHGG